MRRNPTFFITALLCIVINVYPQQKEKTFDFQSIHPQKDYFFDNASEIVQVMKVDSSKITNDGLVLSPIRKLEFSSEESPTPFGATWLGEKILITENWNYFFNYNNDTIKIKTSAELDETWPAFIINEEQIVQAKVLKIESKDFLGITDIIKTISFQVLNQQQQVVEHNLNNKTIEISKNNGLIKSINLYQFPTPKENSDSFYAKATYSLIGLSEGTNKGIKNLTSYDIFDFSEGDELHIIYTEKNDPIVGGGHGGEIIKYSVEKYVSREENEQGITYKKEIESLETNTSLPEGNSNSIYKKYTENEYIDINQLKEFDKLPGEVFMQGNQARCYIMDIEGNSKTMPSGGDVIYYNQNENQWEYMIVDGCLPSYSYYKGLGGPYYYCSWTSSQERKLVYYKKGEIIWGEPLAFTGMTEITKTAPLSIYPNPAKDYISITQEITSQSESIVFELYDLAGKILLQKTLIQENKVNISFLSSGLYIYKLTDKSGKLLNQGKVFKIQ